jgi:hypothetical protein
MSERRLSSRAVKIGALGIASVAFATWGFVACDPFGDDSTADCVIGPDANGEYQVLADSYCDDDGGTYYYNGVNHSTFWYYNAHRRYGNHIGGGTSLRPKKGGITSHSGTSIRKGGFGGSSSSHSSGG